MPRQEERAWKIFQARVPTDTHSVIRLYFNASSLLCGPAKCCNGVLFFPGEPARPFKDDKDIVGGGAIRRIEKQHIF